MLHEPTADLGTKSWNGDLGPLSEGRCLVWRATARIEAAYVDLFSPDMDHGRTLNS